MKGKGRVLVKGKGSVLRKGKGRVLGKDKGRVLVKGKGRVLVKGIWKVMYMPVLYYKVKRTMYTGGCNVRILCSLRKFLLLSVSTDSYVRM